MLTLFFPGEDAFYEGMNRDIYENFKSIRRSYKLLSLITGFDLKSLIYKSFGELKDNMSDEQIKISILVTSINLYKVFKSSNEINIDYYTGEGIGLLSAAVAANMIPLRLAIFLIRFKMDDKIYTMKLKKGVFNKNDSKDIYKKSDIILDIGPSFTFINSDNISDAIISHIDNKYDSSYALDYIKSNKFLNYLYASKRLIGVAAATKNNSSDKDSYQKLDKIYANLRQKVDLAQRDFYEKQISFTKEGFEECKELLKEILILKSVSPLEVSKELLEIESETAIDLLIEF